MRPHHEILLSTPSLHFFSRMRSARNRLNSGSVQRSLCLNEARYNWIVLDNSTDCLHQTDRTVMHLATSSSNEISDRNKIFKQPYATNSAFFEQNLENTFYIKFFVYLLSERPLLKQKRLVTVMGKILHKKTTFQRIMRYFCRAKRVICIAVSLDLNKSVRPKHLESLTSSSASPQISCNGCNPSWCWLLFSIPRHNETQMSNDIYKQVNYTSQIVWRGELKMGRSR